MSEELKASSAKVQACLSQHGYEFIVQQLPASTRTATEAAKAIGCSVPQIAKSLIFKNAETSEPILVIASGSNMVCTDKIEKAIGLKLSKANAQFVREKIGYAIGGVPPIAHKEKVTTIIDPDLKQYDTLWAAAGTPNSVFELKAGDLESLTGGRWVELAK